MSGAQARHRADEGNSLTITVRFLAQLRDLAGVDEASVELPEGTTVAGLIRSLRELFPDLYPAAERAAFMVNQTNAVPETVLSDGDRIIVLQVLGGG